LTSTEARDEPYKKEPHEDNMGSIEAAQARILATRSHEGPNVRIRLRGLLDGLTVVLAVTSIIFAYVQKMDSNELKNKTELLLGSASTSFVDQFPNSIPTITNMMQDTCADLNIMTDVPGYGEYSASESFYWYMREILDLRHRTIKANRDAKRCIGKSVDQSRLLQAPAVRLLLFEPRDREVSLRQQFPPEVFERELVDPKQASTQETFLTFFKSNPDLLKETPEEFLQRVQAGTGYEDFIHAVLSAHHEHEEALRKAGVSVRYAREPFTTRVWIQDAQQAAFSFDHSSATEIAFQTRDSKLLENFDQIFEQQWSTAVCYDDYWNAKKKNPGIPMAEMKDCK
jgi:hypothetical protein